MNWNDLQFLLAAAREKNLSAAGRRLGVNQTTVSRRLQQLQDELRVRLFDHTRQGIELTAAGEEVLRAARAVEDTMGSLDRAVAGGDARLQGPLRITTTELLATWEPDLFVSFANEHPAVELELAVSDMALNISRRDADLALRFAAKPPADLIAKKLARVDYAPYAASSLMASFGKRPLLDALPWLAWDESKGARGTATWMRAHLSQVRIACRFDSGVAMHAAVRAGMGAAILPCRYADRDDGLRRLRPPAPELGWDLWLLMHPDLRRNARVKAFADHTVRFFAQP